KDRSFAYESTKMREQQTRDELVITVIVAYLTVLSNEDKIQAAGKQVETSRATVDRLQVMNEKGAIKPSDLSDAKGQMMDEELVILDLKTALESSKLQLAQLMNINYDSSMRLDRINVEEFLALYPATPSEVYQSSLTQFAL